MNTTMAVVSSSSMSFTSTSPLHLPRVEVKAAKLPRLSFSVQAVSNSQSGGGGGHVRRRVWRRRELAKKDPTLKYRMERTPFLEEQVNKIKDGGKLVGLDVATLLMSEENRFDFVNEVAAEAIQYVENNPDEYLEKKAVLHALTTRLNDIGISRPEGYYEPDPYQPDPESVRYKETCSCLATFVKRIVFSQEWFLGKADVYASGLPDSFPPPPPYQPPSPWKLIWNIQVPPEVSHFWWNGWVFNKIPFTASSGSTVMLRGGEVDQMAL